MYFLFNRTTLQFLLHHYSCSICAPFMILLGPRWRIVVNNADVQKGRHNAPTRGDPFNVAQCMLPLRQDRSAPSLRPDIQLYFVSSNCVEVSVSPLARGQDPRLVCVGSYLGGPASYGTLCH
jgi:hypothetical protein